MGTILERLRTWFRATPPIDPQPEAPPDLLLHYSMFGRGAVCGFGDGVYRWTAELEQVTCPLCLERTEKMRLHNAVTVR